MSYSSQTLANPSFIKRFSHRGRIDKALELVGEAGASSLLDVGAGDCFFTFRAAENFPDIEKVVAFEPVEDQLTGVQSLLSDPAGSGSRVKIVSDWNGVGKDSFDVVTCLEVMEHLRDDKLNEVFRSICSVMHEGSTLIISVPIETGISGLLKNIIRGILRQSHVGVTFWAVLRSAFSLKVNRGNAEYIKSHVGFNHQNIEQLITHHLLSIKKRIFTPFPFGSLLNSQVFFICTKRKGNPG